MGLLHSTWTGSEAFTPDVGSEGAQLAEAAGDLQGAVSSEQDVLHGGRVDLIHQDVGHPFRAALHLLQDLGELRVVKVISWKNKKTNCEKKNKKSITIKQ